MVNLSVREFKEVCDTLSSKQFIFSSENQPWHKVGHTINVKLTFTIMLIALNPNAICFKNKDGCLCLDRVKRIILSDAKSILGSVFTVICGDCGSDTNDVAYTIIAR